MFAPDGSPGELGGPPAPKLRRRSLAWDVLFPELLTKALVFPPASGCEFITVRNCHSICLSRRRRVLAIMRYIPWSGGCVSNPTAQVSSAHRHAFLIFYVYTVHDREDGDRAFRETTSLATTNCQIFMHHASEKFANFSTILFDFVVPFPFLSHFPLIILYSLHRSTQQADENENAPLPFGRGGGGVLPSQRRCARIAHIDATRVIYLSMMTQHQNYESIAYQCRCVEAIIGHTLDFILFFACVFASYNDYVTTQVAALEQ